MQIVKTLTAYLSLNSFGPGYTYEFYVETTNCPTEFTEGQILCSGPITDPNEYLECTITYDSSLCTHLVIGLKVLQDGDECTKIHYDIINDETSTVKHYQCIMANEGDISSCQEFPGSASGAGEYETIEDCISCTTCPCKTTEDPCDTVQFSVSYQCHPEGPQYPGTLTICLTSGATPGSPIILEGFNITHPNGTIIYTDIDEEIFVIDGQCIEVADVILPSGQYIAVASFNTPNCINVQSEFTVNCPLTPNPSDPDVIQCCATTSDAGGSDVGNIGNISCYVLFYPSDMDTNEDIVIDFGANGVADKLVVYSGIADCENILAFTPIASTPYLGTLSAGVPGKCHNIAPNFVPAIGSPSDPENTVVEGCWVGNNALGVYHPTNNPGSLVGSSLSLGNPSWAEDLESFAPTHQQISNNPPVYIPVEGNGGVEDGRGRLIIKGGTYGNVDNALTIVIHNNGSTFVSVPPNAMCGTNTTAWKFYVHCPACPECEGNFELTPGCVGSAVGKIDIEITGDYQSPVNFFFTPNSVSWLFYLLDQGAPFLYRTSNNTHYQLSHPESTNYLTCTINDDILDGETFRFVKVYNGTSYIDGDVNNGIWTVRITDAMGCDNSQTAKVSCNCQLSFTTFGNTSVCDNTPVYITLSINGAPCNVFANTIFDGLPAWLEVTNASGMFNQLVIKKRSGFTQVPGNYTITFTYNCGAGCFLTDEIQITIKDFTCSVSASVNGTTCGNNNGSIALTLCGGATVLWNTGSTNTTISGLAPGVYTATVTGPNACTQTFSYTIGSDSPVTFTVVDETLDCATLNAASILVDNINGGTAPYTINLWNSDLVLVFGPQVVAGPGPVDYTILHAAVTGGLVPDTYKVAVTDANGCETAYNVTIDTDITPELNVSASSATCNYNNGILTFFVNTGIYPGSYTYYWAEQAEGLDCNNLRVGNETISNTVTGISAGDYTVCVENISTNCCICEDVTVPTTSTVPTVPTIQNKTICEGQSAVLTGSCTGGGTLQLFADSDGETLLASNIVSPTVTTTYYARCANNNCMSALVPIIVTVNPSPTANAGTDRYKCASGSCNAGLVVLSGTCTGCVGCTAAWYNGTSLVVGSGLTASVNPSSTTTYTFKCTSPNGCVDTDTATVWVSAPPVVTVNNVTTCSGVSVSFNSVITSPIPVTSSVQWYSSSNCSGSALPSPNSLVHNTPGTYNYSVKVTNADNNCCTCVNFTVTVTASPSATPTYSFNCNTNNVTLAVNAGTCSGNPCTVSWTKQGSPTVIGTSATLIIPYTGPSVNGTYNVTVNCCGCISTGSVVVSIDPVPTIMLPADVSFCKGSGTYPVNISMTGLTNFTWTSTWSGSAATYPITATCTNACPNPIQVSKANAGVLTINASATAANGCTVTDTMVITITNGPVITLQPACKTADNTWMDVITDYNPSYTYYWANMPALPNMSTCGSNAGFQITNPNTPLSSTGASGQIIIRAESGSCCVTATTNIYLAPHLTALNYTCTPSTTDNLASVLLYLVPGNYLGSPYIITILGTNLSDGTTTSNTVSISGPAAQNVVVNPVSAGTWEFTAYIGTNPTTPLATCPSTTVIDVECCAQCPVTQYFGTRTLFIGTLPGIAQAPSNATIKWPQVFTAGFPLSAKILPSDRATVKIYDNLGNTVFTQSNIIMKNGSGAAITNNVSITGIADGIYSMEVEARTAGNVLYCRTAQALSVIGGLLTSDPASSYLDAPFPSGKYNLTLTMCNKGDITPRTDGIYTVTNTAGETVVVSSCENGFDPLLLETLIVPQSVIRVEYKCHSMCIDCVGPCVECASFIPQLKWTPVRPVFVDIFPYCS